MRPAFPYYGGKSRIADRVVAMMPPHKVYVEPFAGGAAVLFAKPPGASQAEVLNDENGDVIALFEAIRDSPAELVSMLDSIPNGPSSLAWAKETLLGMEPGMDPIRRAAATFACLAMAFGADMSGGFRRDVAGNNGRPRYVRYRDAIRSRGVVDRLRDVTLECRDALDVIRAYDSPGTLFYVDPPYPGACQGHYGGYALEDYAALVDVLAGIKGSFILSNYVQDGVAMPEGWAVHEVRARALNGDDRARTELLIANFGHRHPCSMF